MKMAYCIAVSLLCAVACYGEQKYNPLENRWETVPDDSNYSLKQNSMNGKHNWSYQPDDSKLEYNSFENKWEWDSGNNPREEKE